MYIVHVCIGIPRGHFARQLFRTAPNLAAAHGWDRSKEAARERQEVKDQRMAPGAQSLRKLGALRYMDMYNINRMVLEVW